LREQIKLLDIWSSTPSIFGGQSELSEVESEFEYEQNEEMNDILIQKLNKEIELEIEREKDF
jgi:hypothetical protein